MIERITEIAKNKGISLRKLEISIGVSNGYLNSMKTNNSIPGGDVLYKISNTYPDINMNWILTGEGSIDTKDSEATSKKQLELSTMIRMIIREENEILKKEIEGILNKGESK
ncbi:hypothetical protein EZY14_009180 [Kordia sp. TARA_039_SRF]|nr:hypothetical protein EZY14_009180 [Kordia sp. TARA_039_SRF]